MILTPLQKLPNNAGNLGSIHSLNNFDFKTFQRNILALGKWLWLSW